MLLYLYSNLQFCNCNFHVAVGENGLTAVPGCHVHYLLMTHSAMQPAFHLFPENLFVGAQDDIPGLFNRAEDSIASGPLGGLVN